MRRKVVRKEKETLRKEKKRMGRENISDWNRTLKLRGRQKH